MSSTAYRVVKNTGYLYAKMGITMFISLYTTRLILGSLGASDFGVFNIVGGSIAMLGFLNGAMASATQRFMSYSEGEGDKEKQKRIFNVSVVLHALIAGVVGVALVFAGFIFFNGLLNIPEGRTSAAIVVYGSLIVSTMFTVMSVPYDAMLNAHENMLYYAIVGILESLLKLAVAFATVFTKGDKLIVYGVLMACIPLVTLSIMRLYCHRHYAECVLAPRKYHDRALMKEMTSFAGWNLMASLSSVFTMQGMSIVMNYFWGVLANAAQAIAAQLSGQVMSFSNTMLKALNPVLTKKEGAHETTTMVNMSITGNKFSFIILSCIAIPFIVEMPYILNLWLRDVPQFTVLFCRLVFVRLMLGQLSVTFPTCIKAVGRIREVMLYESMIWISILPLGIVVYLLGAPIHFIYLLLIMLVITRDSVMIYFTWKICGLNVLKFLRVCVIPCSLSSLLTMVSGQVVKVFMPMGFERLIVSVCIMVLMFLTLGYLVCLDSTERDALRNIFIKVRRKVVDY